MSTRTCPNCGAALENGPKCVYCGTEVDIDADANPTESRQEAEQSAQDPPTGNTAFAAAGYDAGAQINPPANIPLTLQAQQPGAVLIFFRQMLVGLYGWMAWWVFESILYHSDEVKYNIFGTKGNILFSQPVMTPYWYIRGFIFLILYPAIMIMLFRDQLIALRFRKRQKVVAKLNRNPFK